MRTLVLLLTLATLTTACCGGTTDRFPWCGGKARVDLSIPY